MPEGSQGRRTHSAYFMLRKFCKPNSHSLDYRASRLLPMSCMGRKVIHATPGIAAGAAQDPSFSRSQLFSRGARTGAALLVGGTALRYAESAKADPLPEGDLAYARLLVGLELLSIDFYARALDAKQYKPHGQKKLREALAHEQAHYQSVGQILLGAALTPAGEGDIDFNYPKNTFKRTGSIAKLGLHLETVSVGAYLGAVANLQSNQLHQQVARIAASEAQHLSVFSAAVGGRRIGPPLPPTLPIDRVSDALDAYTS